MRRDLDYLNALAICHFIFAALELLAALAGALYVVIGYVIMTGPPPAVPPGAAPPPTGLVGGMLMLMGIGITVLGLVGAVLTLVAGLDLRKQRRWTFSFVMAVVNAALGFPLGTVLGVFTIIVLMRPSVKALYAGETYVEVHDDDYTRYRRVGDAEDEPAPTRRRPGDAADERYQAH